MAAESALPVVRSTRPSRAAACRALAPSASAAATCAARCLSSMNAIRWGSAYAAVARPPRGHCAAVVRRMPLRHLPPAWRVRMARMHALARSRTDALWKPSASLHAVVNDQPHGRCASRCCSFDTQESHILTRMTHPHAQPAGAPACGGRCRARPAARTPGWPRPARARPPAPPAPPACAPWRAATPCVAILMLANSAVLSAGTAAQDRTAGPTGKPDVHRPRLHALLFAQLACAANLMMEWYARRCMRTHFST